MTDLSNYAYHVQLAAWEFVALSTRPSVLYRPHLSADGKKWCALLGDDLAVGVAGFGDTPEEAMAAFDTAWRSVRTPKAALSLRTKSAAEAIQDVRSDLSEIVSSS